ncbi:MAG: D-alanine--D-alanine ligase [Planctomycetes bacterium]|nr:D-alanine--D-alanine ligase [Planctomycetota bacterium]
MVTERAQRPEVDKPSRVRGGAEVMRVAVLMGGISSEREVSLSSGRAVAKALEEAGYDVMPIVVNDEEIRELDAADVDVAFIALHGRFGEDGGVQRLLEARGIPYTGSGVRASRMAMDKAETKWTFVLSGIPTPKFLTLKRGQPIQELEGLLIERLPMPLVVKPSGSGSSVGVSVVHDNKELPQALETAFRYDEKAIIERYVSGRELTVGILGDAALPVIEIRPAREFYDSSAKYEDNKTRYITAPDVPDAVLGRARQLALKAHLELGCVGFSRVDMMLSKDMELFLLEVNTIPGFTERSLMPMAADVAGISFLELCREIVSLADSGMKPVVEIADLKCVGV